MTTPAGSIRLARLFTSLAHLGGKLRDYVLPAECFLCGCLLDHDELLCTDCYKLLPSIARPCHRCGLPLPEANPASAINPDSSAEAHGRHYTPLYCGECLSDPPAFRLAVSPFLYQPPLSTMIPAWKYHGQIQHTERLAQLLSNAVVARYQECEEALPDCLIAVPIHWTRRLRRGFNQSELLTRRLSRTLGIPLDNKLLSRRLATGHQRGLDKSRRHKNLAGAFLVRSGAPAYRRVAIIDDVITTGSTLREIAGVLKQSGIEQIDVWALARTPRYG